MLRFSLLGAGRIGRMHARNLAADPRVELVSVYDVDRSATRGAAEETNASEAPSVEAAIAGVDAVLIASPTKTHVDLITQAVEAGLAVLCEKPIDLDIDRVEACRERIAELGSRVQVGFNRRFDLSHGGLQRAVRNGEIGRCEQLVITSRDPAPPPLAYIKVSGGLFRDMMIHDFDLARFILDEDPIEVRAVASSLVDPEIGAAGDVDNAMVVMKTPSGALCHINCSRRSVYGYDQRVEAFGSEGMVISGNHATTNLERWDKQATASREPLLPFFIERYAESYRAQISAFVDAVEQDSAPSPSFEDGRRAMILADAAAESLRSGRAVRPVY